MTGVSGDFVDPFDLMTDPPVDLQILVGQARQVAGVHQLARQNVLALPGAVEFGIADALGDQDRAYLVCSYDDAVRVLRDEPAFGPESLRRNWVGRRCPMALTFSEDADHFRRRKLVSPGFRAAALKRWRESFIRPLAHAVVDQFAADGHVEFNTQFAAELPTRVTSKILGLPDEDFQRFRTWANDIVAGPHAPEAAEKAAVELRDYLVGTVADAVARQPDTLIGDMVSARTDSAQADGARLGADDEVLDILVQMVIAGSETTYRALGTLMFALLTHPDQLQAVLDDRELLKPAVEEALRWEPPLPFDMRTARGPARLGEFDLDDGDVVLISLAAACRDETRFPDPERFWINRPATANHLAFATGPHVCIGANVARLEMKVAFEVLLDRLPSLRIDPNADPQPYMRGLHSRGPSRLPLLFDPAPA